jgi:hypothetical protein
VQRWRQQGRGPRFVRVGSQIRYHVSDLDEWLSTRMALSTADPVPGYRGAIPRAERDAPTAAE